MNKNDIMSLVSSAAGIDKQQAQTAVETVFNSIADELGQGSEVRIVGFGTFSVGHRAATTGRNPRTGETIEIAATKLPKFKAAPPLKEKVKKG